MYPYFEVLGITVYMTWIGIIVFLICFICIALALCKKRHQDFYKLFYWIPLAIAITYIMWAYVYFFLNVWIVPTTKAELINMINPYGYNFHFVWILVWAVISLIIFFSKIKRYESKQIWIDIFFFSTTLSMIPLWVCLAFGDNFIWTYSTWRSAVKPLTTASELNKLWSVHPVWLYLSFMAIITTLIWWFTKAKIKEFGLGLLGFVLLLIWLTIVFYFQQYPKYWVTSLLWITFDIKHYAAIFTILLCLAVYFKWKRHTKNTLPTEWV